MNDSERQSFEQAEAARPPGVLSEFMGFVLHNKRWWLTPVVVVLLLLGALVILGGTGVAPFIYTLF
jgi:hypothetical protein